MPEPSDKLTSATGIGRTEHGWKLGDFFIDRRLPSRHFDIKTF